ncbi:2-iminobutanoate/2-iminopropanoate deaminase [bioreactor metagenome]|uniref:2-iminobutanoate/2-iminopropanoate deaminase n=1 Tax=bioreactor metagenome TaxID=1076179 RepID=A0A644U8D0_9ZZZZ|nr:RidA family protein [Negativicutes bacterium]
MQMINTPYSLNSKGHYSPAVVYNGIVHVSGQLPINYAEGKTMPSGSIEEQTRQALENLNYVLKQAGSSKEKVLKTTVYIPDIAYWPIVNTIYQEFFGSHKPARTIVPTTALHFDALIEIDAVAAE